MPKRLSGYSQVWYFEDDAETATVGVFHPGIAPMQPGDALNGRQADAGAGGVRVETLEEPENSFAKFDRNAGAGIADGNSDSVGRRLRVESDNTALAAAVLDGVTKHVLEGERQPAGVGADGRERARPLNFDAARRQAGLHSGKYFIDEGGKFQVLPVERVAGDVDVFGQAVQHRAHAASTLFDPVGGVEDLGHILFAHVTAEQVREAGNGDEGRFQVMHEDRGELLELGDERRGVENGRKRRWRRLWQRHYDSLSGPGEQVYGGRASDLRA
jgi:hypothetical protein